MIRIEMHFKRYPFLGRLTDYNDRAPTKSGKSFGLEVTLEDGSKAYTVAGPVYLEIDPQLRSPEGSGWAEWGYGIGRTVKGEYILWKGMKVIVRLDDPTKP